MANVVKTTATYDEALGLARDLLDGVDENSPQHTREYARGVVEILAQMFPTEAGYTEPGKAHIAAELGIDPGMVR